MLLLLLSSFPTDEDELEVVLLAELCLLLRLTSNAFLSDVEVLEELEVAEVDPDDGTMEPRTDEEEVLFEDFPFWLFVDKLEVSSLFGRCSWLDRPLS